VNITIELPKMDDMKKEDLPEAYHDLWDICCCINISKGEDDNLFNAPSTVLFS